MSTEPTFVERAAERSRLVQDSRTRSLQRATSMVDAARRLIAAKGFDFTTQELVREAGVAMQTFYNYFASKDHLLLAVIESMVSEFCESYAAEAAKLKDPLKRLKFYVSALVARTLDGPQKGAQFMTSEHWRLARLYPEELARANRPFTDLLLPEILAAADAGQLRADAGEYDAWLVTQLLMAVFHHYSYSSPDETAAQVEERLWRFCLGALGGEVPAAKRVRRATRGA